MGRGKSSDPGANRSKVVGCKWNPSSHLLRQASKSRQPLERRLLQKVAKPAGRGMHVNMPAWKKKLMAGESLESHDHETDSVSNLQQLDVGRLEGKDVGNTNSTSDTTTTTPLQPLSSTSSSNSRNHGREVKRNHLGDLDDDDYFYHRKSSHDGRHERHRRHSSSRSHSHSRDGSHSHRKSQRDRYESSGFGGDDSSSHLPLFPPDVNNLQGPAVPGRSVAVPAGAPGYYSQPNSNTGSAVQYYAHTGIYYPQNQPTTYTRNGYYQSLPTTVECPSVRNGTGYGYQGSYAVSDYTGGAAPRAAPYSTGNPPSQAYAVPSAGSRYYEEPPRLSSSANSTSCSYANGPQSAQPASYNVSSGIGDMPGHSVRPPGLD